MTILGISVFSDINQCLKKTKQKQEKLLNLSIWLKGISRTCTNLTFFNLSPYLMKASKTVTRKSIIDPF